MMLQPLRSKAQGQQSIADSLTRAAPIRGWNTRDPLASMDPTFALQLDNWLPTVGKVILRPGMTDWQTAVPAVTKTLCPWRGPATQKLFASTDTGFYDVTAGGTVAPTLVQARTEGYCCFINFTTTGGQFLVTVNGVDDLAYTNGTVWSTVANFVIGAGPATILTKDIFNLNSFKRSMFFLKKDSMSFFFLPIDQILGTVSEFPLGALFTKGGKLRAMSTWTIDGGNGPEDYSAFVTDQGEVAVYSGTDPSSASTWALKGVYTMDPPIGAKCFFKFGGDLLLLTRRGLFSLTATLREGKMTSKASMSDLISSAFTDVSASQGNTKGWEIVEHSDWDVLLVNVPLSAYGTSLQYVLNTKTGAWCRFIGWDGYTFAFLNNELYMGMANKVTKVFIPGNDVAASITAEAHTAFDYARPRSVIKHWSGMRPNLTLGGVVAVNCAMISDFGAASTAQYTAAIFNTAAISRWDSSLWDQALWSAVDVVKNEWVTVAADDSYCVATCLRVIARDASVAWSSTDLLFEPGAILG